MKVAFAVCFDGSGDGIDHGQRETQAVLQAAAPFVGTAVGLGGHELLQQVSVCAVDFHAVKPGLHREGGGIGIGGDELFDFGGGKFARAAGFFGRRGDDVGGKLFGGEFAAVVDLQDGFRALRLGDSGDFAQAGQVVLIDGVRLAVKGFAVGLHQRGGGDKQAEATEAILQKRALLVGDVAVFIRSEVRHGGNGEAVGNGGTVVEGVGLEDGVHFVSFLMERVDAFLMVRVESRFAGIGKNIC